MRVRLSGIGPVVNKTPPSTVIRGLAVMVLPTTCQGRGSGLGWHVG
jgi:hypothetical protein